MTTDKVVDIHNKNWCDFIMQIDGISLFDVIDFPYMIELEDI